MKKLSLFIPFLLLSACSPQKEPETTTYEGFFTEGHEVSSFIPCNTAKDYWLNGSKVEMATLRDFSLQLSNERNKPYQAIYVKFTGKPEEREPVGFETEYDGLLFLDKVITYGIEVPASCKNLLAIE